MRISDWSSDVCSSDLNQMNPSADVLALSSTQIDISAIQPGQAIKTSWRKQPVFVRNLVAKEIAEAKKVPLGDSRDPQTRDEGPKPGKENSTEERRAGEKCGGPGRERGTQEP